MMDSATTLGLAFLAGIYAPVGAPCVLALYPAYLSFLAGNASAVREDGIRPSPLHLGGAVAAGIILALAAGGILLALLLAWLGPVVRAVIVPAAFFLLLAFSLLLILGRDIPGAGASGRLPRGVTPTGSAFLLGLLMGVIILPCNAAALAVLLLLAATAQGAFEALYTFLAFGLGMILPLLLLAGIAGLRARQVTAFLTRYGSLVRKTAGVVMLSVAVYYLILIILSGGTV